MNPARADTVFPPEPPSHPAAAQSPGKGAVDSPHPSCAPIETYQADYVQKEYNLSRHMGFYYELAFRDLYPGPPMCDCQHTTKRPDADGSGNYFEDFNFQCGPLPGYRAKPMPIRTVIELNRSSVDDKRAVYTQTITRAMGLNIPKWMHSSFDTGVIAFDQSGDGQYEWVIEFTCGGLRSIFSGGFVGLNLYSRTLSHKNLDTMLGVVKSLNLSWVLEKDFYKPNHNESICLYNYSGQANPSFSAGEVSKVQGRQVGARAFGGELVSAKGLALPGRKSPASGPDSSEFQTSIANGPNPICMAVHCGKQLLACELERNMCAKGLSCTQSCAKNNNTLACLYGCLNSYEDAAYSDFVRCAITNHHCMSPPPPSGQIKHCKVPKLTDSTFDVTSALHGRWYIPVGLNPVIDCYPCQYGDWGFADNSAMSAMGEQQQVHFTFKVPTLQGGFRNRTLNENVSLADLEKGASFSLLAHADGLNQRQNFTVIAARDDVVVAYWCADNNIGSLLDGINVFTREKQLPKDAEAWLRQAISQAGFDYSDLCQVDNTNHCDY